MERSQYIGRSSVTVYFCAVWTGLIWTLWFGSEHPNDLSLKIHGTWLKLVWKVPRVARKYYASAGTAQKSYLGSITTMLRTLWNMMAAPSSPSYFLVPSILTIFHFLLLSFYNSIYCFSFSVFFFKLVSFFVSLLLFLRSRVSSMSNFPRPKYYKSTSLGESSFLAGDLGPRRCEVV